MEKEGRGLKRLAALALGCGLVVLAEVGLSVLGVRPLAREDRFAGFEGSVPLFVPDGQAGVFRLNPSKRRFFNDQSFRMPKPAGTVRIVSFGGSVTFGHPFRNETSFPAWTARLLQRYDRTHTYENVNAGGISYASYRVSRLMEELSEFSPDLYVLYSGHNEFLERQTFGNLLLERPMLRRLRAVLHRSRIYSALYRVLRERGAAGPRPQGTALLPAEVKTALEQVGGPDLYHRDEEFRGEVIRQYRECVESMVRLCRARRIPLILCTLPSNLSGVSPFKSEHRPGMTENELRAWAAAFGSGETALQSQDLERALDRFKEAEALDDRYALLHFLKGLALEALGREDEAYEAFRRAKEEDIIPLRALDAFNDALREIASRHGIPLVDAEGVFRGLSPSGIPGASLFSDHVHPTLEGQQLIALLVVDAATRAGLVPLGEGAWLQTRANAMRVLHEELAGIGAGYRAQGDWVVGGTYLWAGKVAEAHGPLLRAWREIKDLPAIPLSLGKIELRRRNWQAALEYSLAARTAGSSDPQIAEMAAWSYLGLGRPEEALAELDRATSSRGALRHVLRGRTLRLLGRTAEGRAELSRAAAEAQETPGVRPQLAVGYLEYGEQGEARNQYLTFLREAGHPDPDRAFEEWLAANRSEDH